MKKQFGVGFIPYEIGVTIILKNSTFECIIEDIRMIQYIKDRRIEFEVMLEDTGGVWYNAELIEKRII